MSSIVQSSSNDINEVPVCYEIECDSSSQKIIVKIGDNRIECPSGGGSVSPSSSGLKGTIDCPALRIIYYVMIYILALLNMQKEIIIIMQLRLIIMKEAL